MSDDLPPAAPDPQNPLSTPSALPTSNTATEASSGTPAIYGELTPEKQHCVDLVAAYEDKLPNLQVHGSRSVSLGKAVWLLRKEYPDDDNKKALLDRLEFSARETNYAHIFATSQWHSQLIGLPSASLQQSKRLILESSRQSNAGDVIEQIKEHAHPIISTSDWNLASIGLFHLCPQAPLQLNTDGGRELQRLLGLILDAFYKDDRAPAKQDSLLTWITTGFARFGKDVWGHVDTKTGIPTRGPPAIKVTLTSLRKEVMDKMPGTFMHPQHADFDAYLNVHSFGPLLGLGMWPHMLLDALAAPALETELKKITQELSDTIARLSPNIGLTVAGHADPVLIQRALVEHRVLGLYYPHFYRSAVDQVYQRAVHLKAVKAEEERDRKRRLLTEVADVAALVSSSSTIPLTLLLWLIQCPPEPALLDKYPVGKWIPIRYYELANAPGQARDIVHTVRLEHLDTILPPARGHLSFGHPTSPNTVVLARCISTHHTKAVHVGTDEPDQHRFRATFQYTLKEAGKDDNTVVKFTVGWLLEHALLHDLVQEKASAFKTGHSVAFAYFYGGGRYANNSLVHMAVSGTPKVGTLVPHQSPNNVTGCLTAIRVLDNGANCVQVLYPLLFEDHPGMYPTFERSFINYTYLSLDDSDAAVAAPGSGPAPQAPPGPPKTEVRTPAGKTAASAAMPPPSESKAKGGKGASGTRGKGRADTAHASEGEASAEGDDLSFIAKPRPTVKVRPTTGRSDHSDGARSAASSSQTGRPIRAAVEKARGKQQEQNAIVLDDSDED